MTSNLLTSQAAGQLRPLFPPLEPHRSGRLAVDAIHEIYWEECGNPGGIPVLFLHGGPGGGLSPAHRRFFNPAYYRIILFDQRGSGKSTPLGEVRANTTQLLIGDIEQLRELLGVRQWLVFGGSWGSTLALAYGQAHPDRCLGFVLRGIFLCGPDEIDWFMNGMRWFYPEVHNAFAGHIPEAERGDLLKAYARRLFCDDPAEYLPAARAWARYEGSCSYLQTNPEAIADFSADPVALGVARLEAHYFLNGGFFGPDQLIGSVDRIRHLPAVIVQGRYDMVCPPATALRLHEKWPEARLEIVTTAGHSALEPGITDALIRATEEFRLRP
ncbi:prolyl aminopeptidase [Lacisediminimonas profundi]|uniref:prolyl aminopeptidase n=1 Tax=Lacisediminimonas profundi TaxID=2603856 RepID=UPI00124B8101|nr:prolyl aminopeptidase [Lacisediminimonas profundi]